MTPRNPWRRFAETRSLRANHDGKKTSAGSGASPVTVGSCRHPRASPPRALDARPVTRRRGRPISRSPTTGFESNPCDTPEARHRPGVQGHQWACTCVTMGSRGHSGQARIRRNPERVRWAQGRVQKWAEWSELIGAVTSDQTSTLRSTARRGLGWSSRRCLDGDRSGQPATMTGPARWQHAPSDAPFAAYARLAYVLRNPS